MHANVLKQILFFERTGNTILIGKMSGLDEQELVENLIQTCFVNRKHKRFELTQEQISESHIEFKERLSNYISSYSLSEGLAALFACHGSNRPKFDHNNLDIMELLRDLLEYQKIRASRVEKKRNDESKKEGGYKGVTHPSNEGDDLYHAAKNGDLNGVIHLFRRERIEDTCLIFLYDGHHTMNILRFVLFLSFSAPSSVSILGRLK